MFTKCDYLDQSSIFTFLKSNLFSKDAKGDFYLRKEIRDSIPEVNKRKKFSFNWPYEIPMLDVYLEFTGSWEELDNDQLVKYYKFLRYDTTCAKYRIKELKRRELVPNSIYIPALYETEENQGYININGMYWGKITKIIDGAPTTLGVSSESEWERMNEEFLVWREILFPLDEPVYNGLPLGALIQFDYDECSECGTIDRLDEEHLCGNCQIDSTIANYSAKAESTLPFKGHAKHIFLGVELELDSSSSRIVEHVKYTKRSLKGHAIVKRDGSVSNGFEIASCPANYEFHVQEFSKFFEKIPPQLLPTNNCGMHVHVDKAKLTDFQIGKLTAFMNNTDNKEFITFIAGRVPNSYCPVDPEKGKLFSNFKGGQRYNTLNLTNQKTIEFRIFASTNKFDVFKKNLQFVRALIEYTTPGNFFGKKLDDVKHHSTFLNWILKQRRKIYPDLSKHLTEFSTSISL